MMRIHRPFLILLMFMITMMPSTLSAQVGTPKLDHETRTNTLNGSSADEKTTSSRPVLTLKPREIDFGTIRPGEGAKGSFGLRNVGSGSLQWTATVPPGWSALEKQTLTGELIQNQGELDVHLSCLDIHIPGMKAYKLPYKIQLIMESGNRRTVYHKDIATGTYRESILINSVGGTRTIFFRFTIDNGQPIPALQVDPLKFDFGVLDIGEKVTRQLILNNKGSGPLKWRIDTLKQTENGSFSSVKKGRYISFLNEETKGKGHCAPSVNLKDHLDIMGPCTDNMGYPEIGAGGSVRYRFSGSGVTLFLRKGPGCGKLLAYVDEKLMNEIDCLSDQYEWTEALIAEGLMDMTHVLTLVPTGGRTTIEGVSLYGREVKSAVPGMIHVFPNSGVTSKETDYINISVNAEHLLPGWYGETIIIQSPGGDAVVEISFEVSANDMPKILDVYRYANGHGYLYTTNPQADAKRLEMAGYQKEGIAFRLFKTGTPGTVSFHRWYHAKKRDHFYSYDISGGGKSLSGYAYEGIIGNIATSRLTNTRGLYRWYHSAKGTHFYTTDQSGEGLAKRGYRFEAIAGYVR